MIDYDVHVWLCLVLFWLGFSPLISILVILLFRLGLDGEFVFWRLTSLGSLGRFIWVSSGLGCGGFFCSFLS
jgi:hypothetical protein